MNFYEDNQKEIRISIHKDKSEQNWFNTTKDSKMFISDGWYSLKEKFNLYSNNKFTGGDYFEIGNNGGSYSLNFNKKDLNKILKTLKDMGYKIKYVKEHNTKITKKEYMLSKPDNKTDIHTEYMTSIFKNM